MPISFVSSGCGDETSNAATLVVQECGTPCPWDLDGDGDVDTTDFFQLIALWGQNPGGPPDFDSNGDVDAIDFFELIGHWGGCP